MAFSSLIVILRCSGRVDDALAEHVGDVEQVGGPVTAVGAAGRRGLSGRVGS